MRNFTSTIALFAPETGAQGAASPHTVEPGKDIPDVKAFQDSQRKVDAAQDTMPRATVDPKVAQMGSNNPPIDTVYVPTAKSKAELEAEFKTTADLILGHDAAGATVINSAMAMVCADLCMLGMRNLGDRDKLGIKDDIGPVSFTKDQNLYDNLRKEATATQTGTGEGKWFSRDTMDTNTFKQYIGKSVRKAVLLAFGIARIGYVPSNLRSMALYKSKGLTDLSGLPEGTDKSQFVRAIMVPENVVWPIVYEVAAIRGGDEIRTGKHHPNANNELIYLSDDVADALYALHFENVGENNIDRDIHGFLLRIKPEKRSTGGSQNQTTSGTTTTSEAPKPGEAILPTFQRLKDVLSKQTDVADGMSPMKGAIMGIWNAITTDGAKIDKECIRLIGLCARDAFEYIKEQMPDDKNISTNVLRAYANLGELLQFHCRYDGKDSNVVLWHPSDDKKAKPYRINVGEGKYETPADFEKKNGNGDKPSEAASKAEEKQPEPVKA